MLIPTKGLAGLTFVVAFLIVMLVYVPPARLFLLFSVPFGCLIALILWFWHKRHPVKTPAANKKPLGL